jgi:hypothetical protein
VTERLADLDGWAAADNLASVGSRCLIADPDRLDAVEAWIESRHLWTRRATLVFTLPWAKEKRGPEQMLGWAARLAEIANGSFKRRSAGGFANCRSATPNASSGFSNNTGGS